MSLHDELVSDQHHRVQCLVCLYLGSLSEPERAEWEAEFALPPKVVTTAALHRALRRRDQAIGESSVQKHRREGHGRSA